MRQAKQSPHAMAGAEIVRARLALDVVTNAPVGEIGRLWAAVRGLIVWDAPVGFEL